jgi:hypothetical protein
LDVYPTLVDLANISASDFMDDDTSTSYKLAARQLHGRTIDNRSKAVASMLGLEGKSFAELLDDPDKPHRDMGFYQYTCASNSGWGKECMGYSVVSILLQRRYTEWVAFNSTSATPNFSNLIAVAEMYDHRLDPGEDENVADAPAQQAARRQLSTALQANFGRQ